MAPTAGGDAGAAAGALRALLPAGSGRVRPGAAGAHPRLRRRAGQAAGHGRPQHAPGHQRAADL